MEYDTSSCARRAPSRFAQADISQACPGVKSPVVPKGVLFFSLLASMLYALDAHGQLSLRIKVPSVVGSVVDEAGQPVAGARVFVENKPHWQDIEWRASIPETNDVLGRSITDAAGDFKIDWSVQEVSAISNIDGGAVLVVFAPGHAIAFRVFSLLYPQDFRAIQLTPGDELAGRVLDENGHPLAGAQVLLDGIYRDVKSIHFLSTMNGILSLIHSSLRPRTKSDVNGNFRLSGLPSGHIALLQVTHPSYPSMRRFQPIDANSPRGIKTITGSFADWYTEYGEPLRMRPEKKSSVLALDKESDLPVSGLDICASFSGERFTTDEHGRADVQGRSGEFDRFFARKRGESVWNRVFYSPDDPSKTLRIARSRVVSGIVRDEVSGRGIEGVGVFTSSPGRYDFEETLTDRDGRYSLSIYSPNPKIELHGPKAPYELPVQRLSTSTDETHAETNPAIHRRVLRLLEGDVSNVDFAIPRYPPVEIQVRDPAGMPLAKSSFWLTSRSSEPLTN